MSSSVNAPFRTCSSSLAACFSSKASWARSTSVSDVAHAQDPAGEPVRVEHLEGVGLLAGAQELDRDAGHGADRERRAAAGVAVDLGQDEAR